MYGAASVCIFSDMAQLLFAQLSTVVIHWHERPVKARTCLLRSWSCDVVLRIANGIGVTELAQRIPLRGMWRYLNLFR